MRYTKKRDLISVVCASRSERAPVLCGTHPGHFHSQSQLPLVRINSPLGCPHCSLRGHNTLQTLYTLISMRENHTRICALNTCLLLFQNISGLNGVPMVAGSPMRHDPVLDGQFGYPPYAMPPHHHHELDPAYMVSSLFQSPIPILIAAL